MGCCRAVRTRRSFLRGGLSLLGLILSSGCTGPPIPGQKSARVPRIGWLGNASRGEELGALRHGLGELGYVEGQTILIEERYAEAEDRRQRPARGLRHPAVAVAASRAPTADVPPAPRAWG